MRKTLLFVSTFLLCILVSPMIWAQVTLTGTSYTETFDGISSGLPTGWSSFTGATGTSLGTAITPALSSTSTWAASTGNFRNVASADGLNSSSSTSAQGTSTDRALAVRQTGTFGDPGAAFAVKLASTTGFQDFKLSLKLQSLDATSARTTTWAIQYGIGNTPSSFTTVTTQDVGGSVFSNNTVNYEFDLALDNIAQPVWVRIVALTASTGANTRPTTGLDDFSLTYTASNTNPRLGVLPKSITGLIYTSGAGPSTAATFTAMGKNLTPSTPVMVTPPPNYELSTDNSSYSTSALSLTPNGDGTLAQTIYTRLAAGLASGAYSGSITVGSTEVTTSKSVAVSGTVYPAGASGPCGVSTQISAIRGAADGITFTATGRVTSSIGTNIYIQDATGGILLYTGTGTSVDLPELSIGDEIQVTGVLATYQTDRELKNFTTCFVKTSTPNSPVTPTVVTAATLCDHKGELVTLQGVSVATPAGATFSGNTNYTLSVGTILRIQNGTDLVGASRPSGSVDITGIVSLFSNACQLLPRSTADVPGATPNTASCPEVGTGGTSITADNTLDIVWWNIEWFGNTGFGPTNEATQQSNVGQQLQAMSADIFCLEEVCDISKLDDQIALLNSSTGKTYARTCGAVDGRTPPIYYSHWFDSPEVSGDASTYAQKVCFVYNTAVVSNVTASQILADPASLSASAWASNRFPLLMNCDVTINGVTKNLKLVGLHAKSGSDVSSYNRRITDYAGLKSYLDATYPTDNIMIMGDYNDDADQSIYVDATTSTTNVSSFNNFVISPDYTVITKQLSTCNISSTASYPDIIDHLTVSNEISTNGSIPASGIQYIQNSVKAIRPIVGGTTTSDHFPVTARFLLISPVSATLVASASAVCGSQPVNLSITVGGLATGQTYSYTVTNGTNSTTAMGISTSATVATITPTVPAAFTLTVLNSANSSASAVSGTITVDSPITVLAGASSTTAAINGVVSLTASGGSTYQWIAPSSATLSNPATTATVSATLLSAGVQTFTLVAAQGSCSQTAFVSITATNGPDITPTINLPQANFANASPENVRNFAVTLFETGYHATAGQVTITITAPLGYTIAFDNTQTSVAVTGGNTLATDNTNWQVSGTPDPKNQQISIIMKTGQAISSAGSINLGFSITRTEANSGSTSNLTVNVNDDTGQGYDINSMNNTYVRILNGI